METLDTNNTPRLGLYVNLLRYAAATMMVLGSLSLVQLISSFAFDSSPNTRAALLSNFNLATFNFATAIGVLIAAKLITLTYTNDQNITWILRQGDKLLLGIACFQCLSFVLIIAYFVSATAQTKHPNFNFQNIFGGVATLLPSMARVLVTFAFALILRKIVPIIEESKTLA